MSNDHYVPQFYLRNFSPDQHPIKSAGEECGSLRLINLARRKFVPEASIRGQCKKAGLHDYRPGLEQALGQLEGVAATAIREIIKSGMPPKLGTENHEALVAFIVIQRSRTLSAGDQADKMADRMFKIAYESEALRRGIDLSRVEMKSEYPVALPLSAAVEAIPLAMQLGVHLLINGTDDDFITSDNPAAAHNLYCEGITYRGVLGWGCTGIQILFPISPRHQLILFDRAVYECPYPSLRAPAASAAANTEY